MIKDLFTGFGYIFKGFRLISTTGMRRFVVIPFLINLVIFSGALWWGYYVLDQFLVRKLPDWLEWLSWLVIPVFALSGLLIVFYGFTLIANLLGSPFNSVLAEKVERKLGGQLINPESSLISLASGGVKSIFGEIKKLTYLVLWAVPLLSLFLIPGINFIAPFSWGLFSAWMLALEYCDYPMGNHQFSLCKERKILRENKALAWGFGGGILLLTLIPVLNFFAMPVGVAAATALWVERLKPSLSSSREIGRL